MCDKKSDPVLTDYDITINSIHQENMFKGTISVCIVYAIFAFILIAVAYFSDNIRELLFDKFLPFTLVYIIGTIVIIMIFIYYIVSFVPKKIDINKIDDNISCPDYWKLEILDDKAIETSFDTENFNKKLFKYRCVMDNAVFNKGTIFKQDKKTTTNPNQQYRLGNKPAFISQVGIGGTLPGNLPITNYTDLLLTTGDDLNKFLNNAREYDKDLYLYKNLNAYGGTNLIYTNNKYNSSNILSELKESALIMNNYKIDNTDKAAPKYIDLTNNRGLNNPNILAAGAAGTHLNARLTSNYYNSPAILTWATTDAYTTDTGKGANMSSYNNKALTTNTATTDYTSTVYDWSTMTDKTAKGKVYAIDTTITATTNFILLGKITTDINNYIYFEGASSITIPLNCFADKILNKIYNFDETYISSTDITAGTIYTVTSLNTANFPKGPKVRLFHKTEREPEILKSAIHQKNIPLTCSAVYPSFLTSKENKYSENNIIRCAYSKICNIPWSDLHCN